MKNITLLFFTSLFSIVLNSQTQVGNDIDGENVNERVGQSVTLARNGQRLALGGNKSSSGLGSVTIYDYNGTSWTQVGNNILGENDLDQIGGVVSFSNDGNTIAVATPLSDELGNNTGQVRVFTLVDGLWEQLGNKLIGEQDSERFGSSVSLSADASLLAVGSLVGTGNEDDTGYVKVYEWDGTEWVIKGSKINGEMFFDYFGAQVSLSNDGNRLAIGAYQAGSNGKAYVYEWNGNDWEQLGNILEGLPSTGSVFSGALQLSGNGETLIVGDSGDDTGGNGSGVVRVFRFDGTNWNQIGSTISAEGFGDGNGAGVAISDFGYVIAVGSPYNSSGFFESGSVRIFQLINNDWTQIGQSIYGEGSDDKSGRAISLSRNGRLVAIGAQFNDEAGQGYGHARVFNLSNVLSINTNTLKNISLYPNPVKDILYINGLSDEKVEIFNALGERLNYNLNTPSEINIEMFSVGIYFLVISNHTNSEVIKFIKI